MNDFSIYTGLKSFIQERRRFFLLTGQGQLLAPITRRCCQITSFWGEIIIITIIKINNLYLTWGTVSVGCQEEQPSRKLMSIFRVFDFPSDCHPPTHSSHRAQWDWHQPQSDYFIFNFIIFLWVVVKTTCPALPGLSWAPQSSQPGVPHGQTQTQKLKPVENSSEFYFSASAPSQPPASPSETTQWIHKVLRTFFPHFRKKYCNSFSKYRNTAIPSLHTEILQFLLQTEGSQCLDLSWPPGKTQRAQQSFTQKRFLHHNLKWNLIQSSNWKLRFLQTAWVRISKHGSPFQGQLGWDNPVLEDVPAHGRRVGTGWVQGPFQLKPFCAFFF